MRENGISVNRRAADLAMALIGDDVALRIGVTRGSAGETLIDAGAAQRGGVEAGLRIAEICLGGLGSVRLVSDNAVPRWPWTLNVSSSQPVIACLGSQYAGWSLSHGVGGQAFHALGSGPARALARKEKVLTDIGYSDEADRAVLVIESGAPPPREIVEQIARDCRISPDALTLIFAPTQSLAGGAQVVARVLEVALHKAHELKFPLERVVEGLGAAPLSPPHPDFVTAMGRTNDAILFGSRVQLFVDCDDGQAERLAANLPSSVSKDYGQPFARVFKDAQFDFYRIDPHLFAPAVVAVTALKSGRTFHAGAIDEKLLEESFGK